MIDRFPPRDEIEWAMRHIHPNWERGPSGMRVYHLKIWLAAAQAVVKTDPSRWWIVV